MVETMDNEFENQTLAPHPVYFSVDGRPASTSFELHGKKYRVDWDGHKISMTEYTKKFCVWHDHPVSNFDLNQFSFGCSGCLIILVSILVSYGFLFFFLKRTTSSPRLEV